VNTMSDDTLRARYPDLLTGTESAGEHEMMRLLDTGYNAVPAPRTHPPVDVPGRGRASSLRPRWRVTGLLLGACLLVALIGGVAFALSSILDLGKPSNATSLNPYFPLSGFRHMHASLLPGSKPEVLVLGTLDVDDIRTAMERWPLVKALNQFGAFSGLKAVDRDCSAPHPLMRIACSLPTFDWSHARYQSPYITFHHLDLLTPKHKPYQRLTGVDRRLYDRFSRIGGSGFTNDPDDVMNTVLQSTNPKTSRALPLIVIGHYLQTISQLVQPGDFTVNSATPPPPGQFPSAQVLSFSTVHDHLVSGTDPPSSHLIEDVNAEANIMTALICRADGEKPAHVCQRAVIKEIDKHVRRG
jgi:hypothetical protein